METTTVLVSTGDLMQNDQLPSFCHFDHVRINGEYEDPHLANSVQMAKPNNATTTGLKLKGKRRQRSHQHSPIGASTGMPCTLPHYYQYLLMQSLEVVDDSREHVLPIDPRSWTKCEVRRWLHEISRHHDIDPALDAAKFPFNGKALCALTLEMIQSRAPLYGKLLYKDVRLRLAKALAAKSNVGADDADLMCRMHGS